MVPGVGEHGASASSDPAAVREFTRALLRDIDALEALIASGRIEAGIRRVGVEQEVFLVRPDGRPAPVGPAVLESVRDPRLTSELGRFNLEANLPPRELGGGFLSALQQELEQTVQVIDRAAAPHGATVLLTGILPTLDKGDLSLANMTPDPRYSVMNDAVMRLRGGPLAVYMRGVDELDLVHDSVMLEAANTSFQIHLQVGASEFSRLYNLAQRITPALLAVSVNSPLLLGRRLWHETRIALFEQSVDPRSGAEQARGGRSRVSFGQSWVDDSVLEIFREDAARFRVLLTRQHDQDPVALVRAGKTPPLSALTLHNGTVWRWNRPCYGVSDGTAHLRIENRVLPSGPTLLDEVANGALFWGLMVGLADIAADVPHELRFELLQQDFLAAARTGLDASLHGLDGRVVPARDLVRELLPAARAGLSRSGVVAEDVDRYLDVIEERAASGRTGARWSLDGFTRLLASGSRAAAAQGVTRAMLGLQRSGLPVHRWPDVQPKSERATTVRDVMSTDLFTVRPEDVVDLAASVMQWRRVRHVPVETQAGELVGLVSHRALLRALALRAQGDEAMAISALMDDAPATVGPDLDTAAAIRRLLEVDAGCLLVVEDGRLVGIVTERDLLRAVAESD